MVNIAGIDDGKMEMALSVLDFISGRRPAWLHRISCGLACTGLSHIYKLVGYCAAGESSPASGCSLLYLPDMPPVILLGS
jgi:hypothetical protein